MNADLAEAFCYLFKLWLIQQHYPLSYSRHLRDSREGFQKLSPVASHAKFVSIWLQNVSAKIKEPNNADF
jgi:hypothetical protein